MNIQNKHQHEIIDQTLLNTPEPKASSTNKKQRIRSTLHPKPVIGYLSEFRDSLGLLSLNDVDLTPTLERPRESVTNLESINVSMQLQRQRHLAEGVLSGKAGLTSMYLKSMVQSEKKLFKNPSETTIDDSDFLSNVSAKCFFPNDISTPRSSLASTDLEGSISSGLDIAANISLLADKIKNTDISIKDLCEQYESLLKGDESVVNDTFLSTEQGANMILQDEHAWRLEFDAMPQPIHDSAFSNVTESSIMDEKPSMGEFFKVKSDKCSTIFTKQSPVKNMSPEALVTNSTMIDDSRNSIRSFNISSTYNIDGIQTPPDYNVSDILRLISNESMSTSYLVDCLTKNNCKIKDPQIVPKSTTTWNGLAQGLNTSQIPEKMVASHRKEEMITIPTLPITQRRLSPKHDTSIQMHHHTDFANCKAPTMQPSNSIRGSVSPKRNISKKINLTDTFQSEKLLCTNVTSCKSSLEDLSDKENMASARNVSPCGNPHCRSPSGSPNRSLTSLRSSSSLDHLIDGRVPVESTKVELVWTTVRVGKTANKDFILRNKMHQKIRFQIMLTGTCFKFVKPEGESQVPVSILLHPLESRSFTVAFVPSSIGAYSERLIIQSTNKAPNQKQSKPSQKILLYGYGGHISPQLLDIPKDSAGRHWLLLGTMDEISDIVTKKFAISNLGTLSAFVDVSITLKHLQVFTGLKIVPNLAVIHAGTTKLFHVRYVPNKDDFRRLNYGAEFSANVCEVVTIKCVFGAEVLRGRIRRLARKLEEHVKTDDMLIRRIIQPIPDENIPADIRLISESIASLKYLVQHLETKEIIVTIEQDMEKTIVPTHNDSTSFQSLYFNSSDVTCIEQNQTSFNVHPKALVLSPNVKHSDVIFLVNTGDKVIHYEIRLNKALVDLVPQSGSITALNTCMVKISCKKNIDVGKNQDLKLTVYSDNSSLEVNIQIMCINIPS